MITNERVKKLRKLFIDLDVDKDGKLSKE